MSIYLDNFEAVLEYIKQGYKVERFDDPMNGTYWKVWITEK